MMKYFMKKYPKSKDPNDDVGNTKGDSSAKTYANPKSANEQNDSDKSVQADKVDMVDPIFVDVSTSEGSGNNVSKVDVIATLDNDIVIIGNNNDEISKYTSFLSSKFMIKDLGILKYFLGVEVLETKNGIFFEPEEVLFGFTGRIWNVSIQVMHAPTKGSLNYAFKVLRYLKGVVKIAANPVFHEKIKHFELDLYFLREKIQEGYVKTEKVKSAENIAAVFTKGL
ncbi:ribonuclease H-like domain-containing protein [Tanacetum coccineum]